MVTSKTCVILVVVVAGIGFGFDRLLAQHGMMSGGIALVMGLVSLAFWRMEQKPKRLKKTWITAQGEITAFRTRMGMQNEKEYAAAITVHTEQGDTEIIDHKWQKTIPQIGEHQEVLLNPENIREGFVYHEEGSVAIIPLMISVGGLIGLILGWCIPDHFISCLFPAKVWANPAFRVLYLLAWAWLLFGVIILLDHWRFFRRATLVEGKVTSFKAEVKNDGRGRTHTMYAEVVSFPFENGTREWCSNVWSWKEPQIGTVRKVGIRWPDMKDALQTSSPSLSTDAMQQGKSPRQKESFRIYSLLPYIVGSILSSLGLIILVILFNLK